MSPDMPQYIEPERLAVTGELITGQIDQVEMPRLASLVSSTAGQVNFSLAFRKGTQGEIQITGNLKTTLTMQCQRCLASMKLVLNNPISIRVVRNKDELESLDSDFEPILANKGKILLLELIEEEVILGLPIAPMHPQSACPATGKTSQYTAKKENPFATLSKLKSGKIQFSGDDKNHGRTKI